MKIKKILIIDDDLTALDIVDYLFENKGFQVTRCTDAASALNKVEEEKPDAILMDLMMPEMSGQECIKNIREKGISTPIVAFTAIDDPRIHKEVLGIGTNAIVTKPCRVANLVKQVESLIA